MRPAKPDAAAQADMFRETLEAILDGNLPERLCGVAPCRAMTPMTRYPTAASAKWFSPWKDRSAALLVCHGPGS
jgi:hypothetical protein